MSNLTPHPISDSDKIHAVVAEYNFVSGLIPFYRRMELTAAGGVAIIGVALIAALAGLEGAAVRAMTVEGRMAVDRAELVVLALAPWLFLPLTLLVVTAIVRIRRASLYIRSYLAQCAPEIFQWETVLTESLFGSTPRMLRPVVWLGLPSTGVLLIVVVPAIVPALGAHFLVPGENFRWVLVGYVGAGVTYLVGVPALFFTYYHEMRPRR